MEAMQNIIASKLRGMSGNFQDKFANLGHRLTFTEGVATFWINMATPLKASGTGAGECH